MKKIVIVAGTRPEAIKLAPLIQQLAKNENFSPLVCNTGQHESLCGETLGYFGILPHAMLHVMRENQGLAPLQARLMDALDHFLAMHSPDAVMVQGDTMSAFCGALAAFYRRLPVFHVEAGLRSRNLGEPFPEEALRQMLARVSALHFAPTNLAKAALLEEGISAQTIFVTGNTVIDALFCIPPEVMAKADRELGRKVDFSSPIILITVHRRENHGERLKNILGAVLQLAQNFPHCQFVLPVHPNPNVRQVVEKTLAKIRNIILTPPLAYPELVRIMRQAVLILTDSGGIQEEAPSFGTPVLVARYETERKEGLEAGCSSLVGADPERITAAASAILAGNGEKKGTCVNPYGDGHASDRIIKHVTDFFRSTNT